MKLELCIPCLFGLEGLVGNELRHMQMENVRPENGRVYFTTDEAGLARANVRSRFGERVLLVMGRFSARTFDELFEGTKALPWERYIPKNGAFPVKGYSLDSALHSVPDCQKIIKKAVADRLAAKYHQPWLPEDGPLYQIQFAIMKDQAVLYLDTTGTGLFKRGYRPAHVAAPLRETLAAAMVDIAGYRGRGDFCDPFCGSGTIAIEAALAAKNRAPGINRHFSAEKWDWLDKGIWQQAIDEARAREFSGEYHIFASDIDPKAVEMAKANAKRAGLHSVRRGRRHPVRPEHRTGRDRHQPALRRAADGKTGGRAAVCAFRSGIPSDQRLAAVPAQLSYGVRAQLWPDRKQKTETLQRHHQV